MNTTSPSASVDRIAARSPARSIAGPLVIRSGAPSSAAMIMAIVVLPSPGGPDISTWSGGRPRRSAPSSTSDSCSRTRAWPTNSSSRLGRSAPSITRSSASASGRHHAGRRASCAHAPVARASRPAPRSCAPSTRSAARRATDTSTAWPARSRPGVPAAGQQFRLDRGDRLVGVPRLPAQADQARPHLVPPGRGRGAPARACRPPRTGGPASPGEPSRPASSSTIRWAPFRPMPGTVVSAVRSSVATARRSASGVNTASIARASRGPTPLAVCSSSNVLRSSSPAKPYRVSASSRTTSEVATLARSPGRSAGQRARRALHEQADAADVDHRAVGRDRGHRPVQVRDHVVLRPGWAVRWGGRPAPATGRPGVAPRPAAASRRWAPPRHRWQIARASASAASAGRGGSASRSSRVTIVRDLGLVGAAAAGDGRLDLARRVQRDRQPAPGGAHDRDRARPGPCPSRSARCAG